MSRFASVLAKSPLIQLDRAFDYLIPEAMGKQIAIGQEVIFPLGRSKKTQVGYVFGLSDTSEYATAAIASIQDASEVLSRQLFDFLRAVADRQCVALGELLALAIPDHMSTVQRLPAIQPRALEVDILVPKLDSALGSRAAVLTSARQLEVAGTLFPDWSLLIIANALGVYSKGKSSIIVVPERSDIDIISDLAQRLGIDDQFVFLKPSQKKSSRYQLFHQIKESQQLIVVGTRSAIFAPVTNLGFIAVHDDSDDSLRDQGSPFTNTRDLALIRAKDDVGLLFTAPYRSVELQRLISIGYLSDHKVLEAPLRISYSEPGLRMDESGFKIVRENLERGPVLVLLPRKGDSASVYCAGCGDKLTCSCGGHFWQPDSTNTKCRLCNKHFVACSSCGSRNQKKGRTGSNRTVAELGKTFPNTAISEATGEKKPTGLKSKNQIVVATPGSAPRVPKGYSAVLILDSDVWLSRQTLNAQQIAIRDWMEAIELMAPTGRAAFAGLPSDLGNALSLGQLIPMAKAALEEVRELGLPPALRICSLQALPETLELAVSAAKSRGAVVLWLDEKTGSALIKFSYNQGPAIAKELRVVAIGATARTQGGTKRRGLRVVMDDPQAL
jgi:primosomal protein N' (replication factor Y) (superfamily II helicase)